MSESLSRSLFPQFTEEWVEVGRPYEEHEEVLMNLKFENGSSQTRSVVKLIKFFFKKPDNMLTEDKLGNGISTRRNSGGKSTNRENKQWNSFHNKNPNHRLRVFTWLYILSYDVASVGLWALFFVAANIEHEIYNVILQKYLVKMIGDL
ncbi:hypothetical protein GLOIN_2v1482886 [Rhizophagus irregularis DAOM 181602=DAOM 197198]|uniref:Uncharacterized protein n=1 Tax=Rhizophagus irregularis (strain DAOM 181602 / DAOM 197198 / MUCL 43194) TaxID=747089 RepID=U9U2P5_RHIID|nr:hypothetical protein GLOIN_2v1482886 [Rhizophagus irregularis DAOM 181602=DAOM 197198]